MEWLLAATLACFVYRALRKRPLRPAIAGHTAMALSDAGNFSLEVIGESPCPNFLRTIAGPGNALHYCEALLVAEGLNARGEGAVVVKIDGARIGRLSCRHARRFRQKLAASGHVGVVCPAVIMRGGRGRENFGVWLDVAL